MRTGKFAGLANLNRANGEGEKRSGQWGKRSDGSYHKYMVLLKKDSWRQAHTRIHAMNDPDLQSSGGRPDFSELVQRLLDEWLAKAT